MDESSFSDLFVTAAAAGHIEIGVWALLSDSTLRPQDLR